MKKTLKISNLKNLNNLINFSEIEKFNLSSKKFISSEKIRIRKFNSRNNRFL